MTESILDVQRLSKSFGGVQALDNFSCTIRSGELIGVIGPNGAGKTTLFDAITRFVDLDRGLIIYNGRNILNVPRSAIVSTGIARTFQNIRLVSRLTVIENVLLCFQNQPREHFLSAIVSGNRSDKNEHRIINKGLEILEEVGLSTMLSHQASELSYGQQKLLSIACCLATGARTLLLDEPIAGVAPGIKRQILSLITRMNSKGKTIVLIEHDVEAVWEVCGRVLFMDEGRLISDGPPGLVRNDRRVLERYVS